jgi:hypothetical protein
LFLELILKTFFDMTGIKKMEKIKCGTDTCPHKLTGLEVGFLYLAKASPDSPFQPVFFSLQHCAHAYFQQYGIPKDGQHLVRMTAESALAAMAKYDSLNRLPKLFLEEYSWALNFARKPSTVRKVHLDSWE